MAVAGDATTHPVEAPTSFLRAHQLGQVGRQQPTTGCRLERTRYSSSGVKEDRRALRDRRGHLTVTYSTRDWTNALQIGRLWERPKRFASVRLNSAGDRPNSAHDRVCRSKTVRVTPSSETVGVARQRRREIESGNSKPVRKREFHPGVLGRPLAGSAAKERRIRKGPRQRAADSRRRPLWLPVPPRYSSGSCAGATSR